MKSKTKKKILLFAGAFIVFFIFTIRDGAIERKGWGFVLGIVFFCSVGWVIAYSSFCWVLDNHQKIIPNLFSKWTISNRNKRYFNCFVLIYIAMQMAERIEYNAYFGVDFSLMWVGLLFVYCWMFVLLNRGYQGLRASLVLLLLASIYMSLVKDPGASGLLEFYGSAIFAIEIILLIFLVLFRFPSNILNKNNTDIIEQ